MSDLLYELPELEYEEPTDIEEAVDLLRKYRSDAKIIAGGTELLNILKDRISGPAQPLPRVLINIKKIAELKGVYINSDGWLHIGSTTTLLDIEESGVIRQIAPILTEAARSVATKQIRALATVGGNLCQRPWCWYFRHPHFNCYKKGGKLCYAVSGNHLHHFSIMNLGVCIAGHPSDLAPALMALDAVVEIANHNGRKEIPLDQFYLDGRSVYDTVLSHEDLIVSIQVPTNMRRRGMAFAKARIRGTWDFSLASAAVVLEFEKGRYHKARIAVGGIAPYPFRLYTAEKSLEGKSIGNTETLLEVVKNTFENAKTLPMSKEKRRIAEATLLTALINAAKQA